MNPVVIDCSILVPLFIAEKNSAASDALWNEIKQGRIVLSAPSLLVAEYGNVLWKKVTRKLLDETGAKAQLTNFIQLPVSYHSLQPLLPLAFSLGLKHKITIYDGLYLSLALKTESPLATLDEKLKRAAMAAEISLYC